jgi:hypothetical protein
MKKPGLRRALDCLGDQLGGLKVRSGRLTRPPISLDIKAQLLPLDQSGQAGSLERRGVDEDVRTAIVLHDETETLLGIVELYSTDSHVGLLVDARTRLYRTIVARRLSEFSDVLRKALNGADSKSGRKLERTRHMIALCKNCKLGFCGPAVLGLQIVASLFMQRGVGETALYKRLCSERVQENAAAEC